MTMLPAGWGPGWALGVVALWVVCEGSGCSSQAWGELQAREQAATRWPLLPPANQRPASSLTTATHCSSRNVTVEGPCESLETARLLASPPLLHSRSVVVGIQFSVFVLACTPPWSSVRLLPSSLAAGTLAVENSPRQHRSSPSSEAASKRRPPPPPCQTSSPGTSRLAASVRLPQLTPGSIAIINSDKVPRAAPPYKILAWLT